VTRLSLEALAGAIGVGDRLIALNGTPLEFQRSASTWVFFFPAENTSLLALSLSLSFSPPLSLAVAHPIARALRCLDGPGHSPATDSGTDMVLTPVDLTLTQAIQHQLASMSRPLRVTFEKPSS